MTQTAPELAAHAATGDDAFIVTLSADGNGYEFQGGGWSYAEAAFTWTLGYESALLLPAPATPGVYEVVLDLFPFLAGTVTEQPLSISVNGEEVLRTVITAGGRVACRARWSGAARDGSLTIGLHHPGAARPSDTKPDSTDRRLLAFAVRSLTLRRLTAGEPAPPPAAAATNFDPARHRLMMGFESLGMNCELGLVQRQCGAEPLGLLRFAFSPIPALLAGLADGFARIGRPETTTVSLHGPTGEYQVQDRAYGFLFHTWLYSGQDTADRAGELQKRECRRLPRLAAKLVETLEEAEKILVFRGEAATSEAEVRRIVEAVRRYGDNTVLWVRAADNAHQAETVQAVGEGLLLGWVDRLAPMQDATRFSFASWAGMLTAADTGR